MLDGFSSYNQVAVHPEDQEKTTFTTPWGTFMYAKMPFGLMNVGATFQRAMDIAFAEEKDKYVVIYLDDITVYFPRQIQTTCSISERSSLSAENLAFPSTQRSLILPWKRENSWATSFLKEALK